MSNTTFSIGQQVQAIFTCDSTLNLNGTIVNRSKHFAIIDIDGYQNKCKIFRVNGSDYIYPLGRYSMCPIFIANIKPIAKK